MNCVFKTKMGWVKLAESSKGVSSICFVKKPEVKPSVRLAGNALKVRAFLNGNEVDLSDVKVDLGQATGFQKKVWRLTRKIRYGETVTYGWLSEKTRSSPRAVGQALKKNPVPVLIPCHRVTSSDGIGGFSCGVRLKKKLLSSETKLK